MALPLRDIIDALATLHVAEEAVEAAYERRKLAELQLAELVGTQRRDKDTGFEAECDAKALIVSAALRGELVPMEAGSE